MNEIATINNVVIITTDDSEKLIPIKPICEALGIDEDAQRRKLKDDEFLSSVTVLSTATGTDGKQYEMVCLPYEFIFGWLFTINPKNVKPEAQEAVAKFRIECYQALYNHFAEPRVFLAAQRDATNAYLDARDKAKENFKNADTILKDIERKLNVTRRMSIEDWRKANREIEIPFEN